MDELYDSVAAALLWVLMLPGVLPLLAVGVLVFGLRHAGRVRHPIRYGTGVIAVAAALVCFSLVPSYAAYVHARGVAEEWFWQALGLIVPFLLLMSGLSAMAGANKTPPADFWKRR